MAVTKFKIDLSQVPQELLREEDGDEVLVLKVPTLQGKKKIVLRDKEVIRTEDPLLKIALEKYVPPRVPIKHRPKGEEKHKHSVYDHALHSSKKPFGSVAANSKHDHDL